MIRAMANDGIFIAALFFEVLAALSLIERFNGIAFPEALTPVMAFYHSQALPVLVPLAHVLHGVLPEWLPDAAVISSVFFFHFFLAQARRAADPIGGERRAGKKDRAEAIVDWALPGGACLIGAMLIGPTLLPLLTVPAALLLLGLHATGRRSWFEVPAGYFANLLSLALVPILIAVFDR